MKQVAKIFVLNTMRANQISIDKQINDYIAEHPTYTIWSVSYILAGVFEKALVIFKYSGEYDIPEEKPKQTEQTEVEETRTDIPNRQFNPKKKHFQQQNNSQN